MVDGVLITTDEQPIGSSYDKWKIYKSSTRTGSFTLLGSVKTLSGNRTFYDEDGLTTDWYKTSFLNSTSNKESKKTDAFPGHFTSYASVQKLRSFLQKAALTDSTNPNIREFLELIWRAEDHIDNYTGHAWRLRYSETNTGQIFTAEYEYHDIFGEFEHRTGVQVALDHRKIRTFDTDEGDVLEIWDGNDWKDFITEETEGRNEDFWVVYTDGLVFIRRRFTIHGPMRARIKYRYGETSVPLDIQTATLKLAATDFFSGMDARSQSLPEGGVTLTHLQKIELWDAQIKAVLDRYSEFRVGDRMF